MAPERKRKSEGPAETPKRARPSSAAPTAKAVAIVATVEIPFGVDPSPDLKEKLCQPLCGYPLYLWVNLRAAALFSQIKSVSSFYG